MGFAAPLLFVCLGTSSRGNLHWAWGGWFCLFVYAVRVFSLFFFFFPELTAIKALLTQWSVGQSSWTHLLASDEKKLCLHASRFLSVISIFALSLRPPSCPCLFPLKEFQEDKSSIFFVFIFLPTRLPGDVSKVTHFLTELTPHTSPHTSLAVREGLRKRENDKGDYFIKGIVILGGQSIIDEVKKQWWLFFFTVRVGSHCL